MNGQLGNGTMIGSLTPVDVPGLMQINSIAAGAVHTCARSASGLALCWGENIVNQLGDGTTTDRSQRVPVAGFM
jgi:alpha-tubulin suppressor-like RCC1 family protein